MRFAGPLTSTEEARGVEQIAFLTQLRTRLRTKRSRHALPVLRLREEPQVLPGDDP